MKRSLVLLGAVFAAACSTSPSAPTAAPSAPPARTAALTSGLTIAGHRSEAPIRTMAAGDVQNGPLEILRVRVRQAARGFYALPGGVYTIAPNVPVELWIEWSPTAPVSTVPRLIIDWAPSVKDNIHCGPCLLTNTYRRNGASQVTVTLDDRVGGVTKRTFTFNVATPRDGPSLSFVSQSIEGSDWQGYFRVAYDTGVTLNVRSIHIWRADTRTLVASEADIAPGLVVDASGLPLVFPIQGSVPCGLTGGSEAYFTFRLEAVGADGETSSLDMETMPFPCDGFRE